MLPEREISVGGESVAVARENRRPFGLPWRRTRMRGAVLERDLEGLARDRKLEPHGVSAGIPSLPQGEHCDGAICPLHAFTYV